MSEMVNPDPSSLGAKQGKKIYSFVNPLFSEQPDIVWDRVKPISRATFAEKYGLCNKGINPKHLRVGMHCTEEDVEALFGVCINQNGYKYCYSEDEEFVKAVEWQWMVCHQRTGLPNTRLINKAEARGLTCERLPGARRREVNWAHFAEWTCRDQLRRIQSERDAKEGGGLLVCKIESGQGGQQDQRDGQEEEKPQHTDQGCKAMLTPKNHEEVEKNVADWRLHLAAVEKELPSIEALVQSLSKEHSTLDLEVLRVEAQLVDRRQLVSSGTRKLSLIQEAVDEKKAKMNELRSQGSLVEEALGECVLELETLQRKVDSQLGMVDAFSDLLSDGEMSYSTAFASLAAAKAALESAVQKQDTMRVLKSALSTQLEYMQASSRRPALEPSPIHLDSRDSALETDSDTVVTLFPCPFCNKSFGPDWDVKLASCKCAYHSWCALTHFSGSLTCGGKYCGKEVHPDWWAHSGIKKPRSNTDGAISGPWDVHSKVYSQESQDPLSTSISFSTVQRDGRSNTLSESLGRQPISQFPLVKEPASLNKKDLEQQEAPVAKTPQKVSPSCPDGKRKKPSKIPADVDADECAGTSEEGLQGSSPQQNEVQDSPDVALGKSPTKKRKKTVQQRKNELALRQSHAKNTRAGKK